MNPDAKRAFLERIGANTNELVAEILAGASLAERAIADQRQAKDDVLSTRMTFAAFELLGWLAAGTRPEELAPADLNNDQIQALGRFCDVADEMARHRLQSVRLRSMDAVGAILGCGAMEISTFLDGLLEDEDPSDLVALRVLFDLGNAVLARHIYRLALNARKEGRDRG